MWPYEKPRCGLALVSCSKRTAQLLICCTSPERDCESWWHPATKSPTPLQAGVRKCCCKFWATSAIQWEVDKPQLWFGHSGFKGKKSMTYGWCLLVNFVLAAQSNILHKNQPNTNHSIWQWRAGSWAVAPELSSLVHSSAPQPCCPPASFLLSPYLSSTHSLH